MRIAKKAIRKVIDSSSRYVVTASPFDVLKQLVSKGVVTKLPLGIYQIGKTDLFAQISETARIDEKKIASLQNSKKGTYFALFSEDGSAAVVLSKKPKQAGSIDNVRLLSGGFTFVGGLPGGTLLFALSTDRL